jgi:hypothetical protein
MAVAGIGQRQMPAGSAPAAEGVTAATPGSAQYVYDNNELTTIFDGPYNSIDEACRDMGLNAHQERVRS